MEYNHINILRIYGNTEYPRLYVKMKSAIYCMYTYKLKLHLHLYKGSRQFTKNRFLHFWKWVASRTRTAPKTLYHPGAAYNSLLLIIFTFLISCSPSLLTKIWTTNSRWEFNTEQLKVCSDLALVQVFSLVCEDSTYLLARVLDDLQEDEYNYYIIISDGFSTATLNHKDVLVCCAFWIWYKSLSLPAWTTSAEIQLLITDNYFRRILNSDTEPQGCPCLSCFLTLLKKSLSTNLVYLSRNLYLGDSSHIE